MEKAALQMKVLGMDVDGDDGWVAVSRERREATSGIQELLRQGKCNGRARVVVGHLDLGLHGAAPLPLSWQVTPDARKIGDRSAELWPEVRAELAASADLPLAETNLRVNGQRARWRALRTASDASPKEEEFHTGDPRGDGGLLKHVGVKETCGAAARRDWLKCPRVRRRLGPMGPCGRFRFRRQKGWDWDPVEKRGSTRNRVGPGTCEVTAEGRT